MLSAMRASHDEEERGILDVAPYPTWRTATEMTWKKVLVMMWGASVGAAVAITALVVEHRCG